MISRNLPWFMCVFLTVTLAAAIARCSSGSRKKTGYQTIKKPPKNCTGILDYAKRSYKTLRSTGLGTDVEEHYFSGGVKFRRDFTPVGPSDRLIFSKKVLAKELLKMIKTCGGVSTNKKFKLNDQNRVFIINQGSEKKQSYRIYKSPHGLAVGAESMGSIQ